MWDNFINKYVFWGIIIYLKMIRYDFIKYYFFKKNIIKLNIFNFYLGIFCL